MSAYIVVDVEVTDAETYERYKKTVPATIEAFGGRFVVRGGAAENIEGEWQPGRIVILEFDSVERAKAWWSSEVYREPKALRQSASKARIIVVDGL